MRRRTKIRQKSAKTAAKGMAANLEPLDFGSWFLASRKLVFSQFYKPTQNR
jgi:hypothetical protein